MPFSKVTIGILVALLLVVCALGLYWMGPEKLVILEGAQSGTKNIDETATISESPVPAPREVPEGMQEYRSDEYGFSLLLPEQMTIGETKEGQGATTLVFEDRAKQQGLQVFIVPFTGTQVSEERFRLDNPSGIRREMKDITIDGATGAAFYSEHPLLGETAEVWFVREGFLYEVTTLKVLAPWLTEILASWQFI